MPTNDTQIRSPLRIFEKATGGGLGSGNLGVVLSRHGVGKTAFLVGMAVDALLRGRKVMHISTEESVEHLRAFYFEIFQLICESQRLDNRLERRLDLERNRHILVYNRKTLSLDKLRQSAEFLHDAAHFSPDMVIMDGTPRFEHCETWEIEGVCELAREWSAEIWTSSRLYREGQTCDARGVPGEVAQFDALISVIIQLEPQDDHVRVRLLKDHDRPEAPELNMELDPGTLLLRWR
ncbi:hypothetical protein KKG45_03740 [bacterium]|nr:hypothetical protein [bacterium]MBU1072339.1 hypothetical protein [bacterium]MBU1675065.1 hypothetical protein [bacterium]